MYTGKHDCRVTARCPYCREITVKEIDYEVEKDMLGKTIAETIPDLVCTRCAKTAFKRSRFDIAAMSAAEPKVEKDG